MNSLKDNKEETIIAVYGTLKKGRGNYNHFLSDAKQIANNAKTINKFALYSAGIPYVDQKEEKTRITVELYSVTNEQLSRIDGLEGHPRWYKREITTVENIDTKETINAWLYFMDISEESKKRLKFHEDGNY